MSVDTFHELSASLRATVDLKQRCDMAGLAREPVERDGITMACDNCIYFLARRAWCDVPELNIPVDPDWYCLLWRV
jgi:hypothetical protein